MNTLLWCALAAAAMPEFRMQEIATGLRRGYQVVAADVNKDGKPDLIALAQGLGEVVWYENPSWERHLLAGGFTEPINIVVTREAMLVADHFSSAPEKSEGHVFVLTPNGSDVRQEWKRREIDRLSTSHRMRVMRIGKDEIVINAPLAAASARAPEYRGAIPLVMYRAPEWKRELIGEQEQGVMHGIFVKGDRLYTASTVGIHEYRHQRNGTWKRTEIDRGHQGAWPKSGASDVAVGEKITASIEPWHGNVIALYEKGKPRRVVDDKVIEGHSVAVADFGRDGREQIIVADRGAAGGVFLYDGPEWKRHVVDGPAMRASSCAVADFNGDGKPDMACIGAATANLRLYENVTKSSAK